MIAGKRAPILRKAASRKEGAGFVCCLCEGQMTKTERDLRQEEGYCAGF